MKFWSAIGTRHLRATMMVLALGLWATTASGTTRYHLRVHAAPTFTQRFVFALTCSDSSNTVTLYDAKNDGSAIVTSAEGGPAMGKLLSGYNPADTTALVGGAFYNDMDLRLQNISYFNCGVDLTEHASQRTSATSQFALYWLNDDETVRLSADPLGANALAVLDITGAAGGELSVFSPMTFVAPDTILLNGELAGVPSDGAADRLRFASIAPNPVRGDVLFSFNLPSRGSVELRVYDVQGRLVATPLRGVREAGSVSATWGGLGRSGSKAAPGVYLAEIRFGRQSAVRRFVITL